MQRNLLDTHTLIWFINGDTTLSNKVRQAVEANDTVNFVSIVSLWEIAVKVSLGKLELKTTYYKIYDQLIDNGFELLPITFEDTLIVSGLPFVHRDPFDRLIIAQAMNNNLIILSKDQHFSSYEATVLW
ncbi:MAG: type II toxin-antitoxin system VapC family toxin [Terrimonas sp.]|nr:type II toxin-antitoxin system VapC family toxin [Terrimonas sp.]OJY80567.1 MAG: twitching motility protein PilT [Sphingobacteriales bacterium 40-81]